MRRGVFVDGVVPVNDETVDVTWRDVVGVFLRDRSVGAGKRTKDKVNSNNIWENIILGVEERLESTK